MERKFGSSTVLDEKREKTVTFHPTVEKSTLVFFLNLHNKKRSSNAEILYYVKRGEIAPSLGQQRVPRRPQKLSTTPAANWE